MKRRARRLAALLVAAILLPVSGGACDPLTSGGVEVEVVNESGTSVLVLALDAETAARADPAFVLQVDGNRDRLIEPGGVLRLTDDDVMGGLGPEEGLVLFLYRVDGDTGTFAGARQVSDAELDDAGGRVTIVPADLGGG